MRGEAERFDDLARHGPAEQRRDAVADLPEAVPFGDMEAKPVGIRMRRAASRTVMTRLSRGWMGRGEVNAPRALSVPARSVLHKP